MALIACTIAVGVPYAITAPGCAIFSSSATPNEKYYEAQELFILAVRNAIAARSANRISDDAWANIYLPAINRGNSILDQMDAARIEGDIDTLAILRSALTELVAQIGVEQ